MSVRSLACSQNQDLSALCTRVRGAQVVACMIFGPRTALCAHLVHTNAAGLAASQVITMRPPVLDAVLEGASSTSLQFLSGKFVGTFGPRGLCTFPIAQPAKGGGFASQCERSVVIVRRRRVKPCLSAWEVQESVHFSGGGNLWLIAWLSLPRILTFGLFQRPRNLRLFRRLARERQDSQRGVHHR